MQVVTDAEAICEAVIRTNMRFVATKSLRRHETAFGPKQTFLFAPHMSAFGGKRTWAGPSPV
jgi:hypothetical protein